LEVRNFIPRRDRNALRPQSLDLPPADGSQLDGADDSVGGHDSIPRQFLGLLGRKVRQNVGNLPGSGSQVAGYFSIGGHAPFRNRADYCQDA
jgi:hypothetical protein